MSIMLYFYGLVYYLETFVTIAS